MKANELRIGNWVLLNDREFKVTITSLHEGANEYFIPLIITEEWLLKFGFIESDGRLTKENCMNLLCLINKKRGLTLSCNLEYDCGPKIEFVHQLQNIYFALAGKELEIK